MNMNPLPAMYIGYASYQDYFSQLKYQLDPQSEFVEYRNEWK